MNLKVNFNNHLGRIKSMHAVGQPPMLGIDTGYFHYLTEAGIPQSRLHDVGGFVTGDKFVDIPNIFRDFSKDENDPSSYSFEFTDILIKALLDAGVEPYFRLGVTIENFRYVKRFTTYPPSDPEKWARICEHIIMHYNEGWADGYEYGIKYWEIWNEPDDCIDPEKSSMWCGSKEDYYNLYDVTSRLLKGHFGDTIKIGGYATTGVYEHARDTDLNGLATKSTTDQDHRIEFIHGFFKYIKAHNSPIDFFSWHSYMDVKATVKQARYYDRILEKYGYSGIERHLNEWNLCWAVPGVSENDKANQRFVPATLSMMLAMQHEPVDILYYYDASISTFCCGGLFSVDTRKPTNTYFAFHMFNSLYKLGNEVMCEGEDEDVYSIAATNEKRSAIVIANTKCENIEIELDLSGVDTETAEILRIDDVYKYTLTGEILKNKITIPANGCCEIRFSKA